MTLTRIGAARSGADVDLAYGLLRLQRVYLGERPDPGHAGEVGHIVPLETL